MPANAPQTATPAGELVAVTQADRERLADYRCGKWETCRANVMAGDSDTDPLAQAFARHRIASTEGLVELVSELVDAARDAEVEIRELRQWIERNVTGEMVSQEAWGQLHKPLVTQAVTRNLRAALARAAGK